MTAGKNPGDRERASRTVVQGIKDLSDATHHRLVAKALEQCGDATGASFERRDAARLEGTGHRLLELPEGVGLTRGPGGEVALHAFPDEADRQLAWTIKDTLEQPDRVSLDASRSRMELLLQVGEGCLTQGLDAAESLGAASSVERMACHQLAVVHQAALRAIALGLSAIGRSEYFGQPASIEGCRLINSATRLLRVYNETLGALARIRSSGRQGVVQHVSVSGGGQAVVAGHFSPEGTAGLREADPR